MYQLFNGGSGRASRLADLTRTPVCDTARVGALSFLKRLHSHMHGRARRAGFDGVGVPGLDQDPVCRK